MPHVRKSDAPPGARKKGREPGQKQPGADAPPEACKGAPPGAGKGAPSGGGGGAKNGCGCQPQGPGRPPLGQPSPPRQGGDGRRRRKQDCCAQILEILGNIPGLNVPKPHKPKQRPGARVHELCRSLPVADALLPAMIEIHDRFRAGAPARNDYEERLYSALDGLGEAKREALGAGFDGYRRLPARARCCLFDDGLVRRGEDGGIRPADVIEAVIREGLAYVGQKLFTGSGGVQGPGQVRLWDRIIAPPPDGAQTPRVYTGPWPWLTAIRPDAGSFQEFGSIESHRAGPGAPPWVPESYQIARDCQVSQDPNKPGELVANCVPRTPPPPPPGQGPSLIPQFCEGGQQYTYHGQCLQLAVVEPGATIALRGFNFITKTVRVVLQHRQDKSVRFELEAPVWGDLETPQKDAQGNAITDWRVRDTAVVTIPNEHPAIPGAPLPPGLYDVSVLVDNVLSVSYAGGVPARLESNALILQVEPDPNVAFHLWSEHGHCYEETDGLGSDEIWFDAWVASFVPAAQPTGPHTLGPLNHVEFDRGAWDDMDSGEDAGGYRADLWNGSFNKGVVVVGLIGFEVDSEAAAREQLRDFGEAFTYFLGQVWSAAIAAEGTAASIAKMVSLTVTQGLIALAVVAAVILLVGLAWAAWAPADRIAIDLFTMDARTAWNLTSPGGQLPAVDRYQFEEVATSHNPQPKAPDTPSTVRYVTEHRYTTPEDGEDSDYGVTFQLARI